MVDLYHATRDELIRIIHQQGDTIAALERQLAARDRDLAEVQTTLAAVTAQVGELRAHQADDDDPPRGTPRGMPGLKPIHAVEREPRPRKKRMQGYGRHRMEATERVVHALRQCPDCGAPLAGGSVKPTREVIELPHPSVVVTEHVYLERCCPECGKRCVPRPELAGEVAGRSRLGHGLVSLIAVLREEGRLPYATIQRLLATLTGLH